MKYRYRLTILAVLILLISSMAVCSPVIGAVEGPKTISCSDALDMRIEHGFIEAHSNHFHCKDIGYVYNDKTKLWIIYDYNKNIKLSINQRTISHDNCAKLLEYMYYVDLCNDNVNNEIGCFAACGASQLGLLAGPAGAAAPIIVCTGAVIADQIITNDMDACSDYAKRIYEELSKTIGHSDL